MGLIWHDEQQMTWFTQIYTPSSVTNAEIIPFTMAVSATIIL